MEKKCIKCDEAKDFTLFAKGSKYKDGRRNICKACHALYMKSYWKANPEKRESNIRNSSKPEANWKRHHISEKNYQELYAKYEGKCHSCKKNNATSIDHDHSCCSGTRSCGKCVRGILCHNCNTSLGLMHDNYNMIILLAEYIK